MTKLDKKEKEETLLKNQEKTDKTDLKDKDSEVKKETIEDKL